MTAADDARDGNLGDFDRRLLTPRLRTAIGEMTLTVDEMQEAVQNLPPVDWGYQSGVFHLNVNLRIRVRVGKALKWIIGVVVSFISLAIAAATWGNYFWSIAQTWFSGLLVQGVPGQ